MSIIIVGAGLVGFQVADRLIEEGKDVTIIENDEVAARYASSRLDCIVITGTGNNLDVLRKAGAEHAQYFIALTGSDEINMICCTLVAAEFNIPNKLARVRNAAYLDSQMAGRAYWGIDYMINPEVEAARAIMQQVDSGTRNYVMLFENLDIQIQCFTIDKDSPLVKQTIHNLAELFAVTFIIPVIQRDGGIVIPDGSSVILEGDTIYIAAGENDFKEIQRHLGEEAPPTNKILLVGGGSIGKTVLHYLMKRQEGGFFRKLSQFIQRKSPRSVRVVERNYKKCKQLSELFPEALVIHADISEENIFEEEGLNECNLLVTATENPELNIVTSLYARTIGIERAITLVRTENYTRIANELGLGITISLKNTVVNSIVRYLLKGNITSIQSAAQGIIDFLELQVDPGSEIIGNQLKDIYLPPETIILYIKRQNETFIPVGESLIEAEDHIIILARKEHVPRIEELVNSGEPSII
ncbi:MAG: Trk system potassium transporter TrkA [Salinispira sp.]